MHIAARVIIAFVALIHIYILWLEMFAWLTRARKVFRTLPQEMFVPTKAMAANQGLYNGFLAAGLIWSLLITDPSWSINVAAFFLGCVLAAGLYGAYSVQKKILFVQAIPAALGIVAIYLL